jgi:hypothetical protein
MSIQGSTGREVPGPDDVPAHDVSPMRWGKMGNSVQRCRCVLARLIAAVTGVALAALLAACSPVAYPSLTANPMPRADDAMTPADLQQATSSLISDRTRLNSDAQAAQASAVASGMSQPAAPAAGTPAAGAAAKP